MREYASTDPQHPEGTIVWDFTDESPSPEDEPTIEPVFLMESVDVPYDADGLPVYSE